MSDRPCYYLRERGKYVRVNGERVLIPGCMGGMHSNSLRYCTCNRTAYRKSLEDRVDALEKQVRRLIAATPGAEGGR